MCSKIPAVPGHTDLLPGKGQQQQDLSWQHQGLQTQMALEDKRNEGFPSQNMEDGQGFFKFFSGKYFGPQQRCFDSELLWCLVGI